MSWTGLDKATLIIGADHDMRRFMSLYSVPTHATFITAGIDIYDSYRQSEMALQHLELGEFMSQLRHMDHTLRYSGMYYGIVYDDYRSLKSYSGLTALEQEAIDKEFPQYGDYGLVLSLDKTGYEDELVLNINPDAEIITEMISQRFGI